jgi:hypothetical protein
LKSARVKVDVMKANGNQNQDVIYIYCEVKISEDTAYKNVTFICFKIELKGEVQN